MNEINPIEQLSRLESRVHELINKIGQLHGQNQRLHDELSLSRQDYEAQTRELETQRQRAEEAVAAVQAAISLPDNGNSELTERIEYQSQQIELIERERTALRDQVSFLQSTLQNKERDWTAKIDHIRQESEQHSAALAAAEAEMQAKKDKQDALYHSTVAEHERQIKQHRSEQDRLTGELQQLQERCDRQEGSLEKQTALALDLQQQLEAALAKHKESDEGHRSKLDEQKTEYETLLEQERTQAQNRLAEEQERLHKEMAEAARQSEHSLKELAEAMNRQEKQLQEELQQLQHENLTLDRQNQEYRDLLAESAADIRKLLKRLPVPDQEDPAATGEAA